MPFLEEIARIDFRFVLVKKDFVVAMAGGLGRTNWIGLSSLLPVLFNARQRMLIELIISGSLMQYVSGKVL